jgi:hypothetical protein
MTIIIFVQQAAVLLGANLAECPMIRESFLGEHLKFDVASSKMVSILRMNKLKKFYYFV